MRKVLEEYSSRDRRVRWQELTENKGIAENTNAAFAMAKGEFVGLLDHDDLLAPNALYEVVNALNQHEHGDAVYTCLLYTSGNIFSPLAVPAIGMEILPYSIVYMMHAT